MAQNERYNGWANRETWAVALHINNDQGWQESVLEDLRVWQSLHDPGDRPVWEAGEVIRENVESVLYADDGWTLQGYMVHILPIIQDIGSLWRVDWAEIGASFLEGLADE